MSGADLTLGGRSVSEWIGANPDSPIPKRVKLRVWERFGGKCALTGRKLRPGDDYDFDHVIALCNGGENREGNLQLVSRAGHREKTADDVKARAKADRVRAKHLGFWPDSKTPLKSRGFAKTREWKVDQ